MPVFSSLNRLSKRFSAQAFQMSNLNGPTQGGANDADIESSVPPGPQPRFMSMLKSSFQDLKKTAQHVVDSIVLDGEDPYPVNPYQGEEINNDDLHSYLYGSVNFTRFPIPGAADELAKEKAPPRYERYLRQSLPPAPTPVSPDLVSDGGSSSASTPLQTPTQTPSPSRLSLRADEYRLSGGYGLGIQAPAICVTPPQVVVSASNRSSRNFLGLKVDVAEDPDQVPSEQQQQQNNGMFVIGEDEEDDTTVEIDLDEEPVRVMMAQTVRVN